MIGNCQDMFDYLHLQAYAHRTEVAVFRNHALDDVTSSNHVSRRTVYLNLAMNEKLCRPSLAILVKNSGSVMAPHFDHLFHVS